MIEEFLQSKKTTVHKVQKLCGFLNFLSRAVIPGRAFTRRLYTMYETKSGVTLKPHHHIRIRSEDKLDLGVWKKFLVNPDAYCQPFVDFNDPEVMEVKMYSDASRNFVHGGFGAWCNDSWMQAFWDTDFMIQSQPSIEYLELFTVAAGVLAWINRFSNQRVKLFCDNESMCFMLNTSSLRCHNCMVLIRLVVLVALQHNVRIYCKHVRTHCNGRADTLSRGQFRRFWRLSPPSTDYVQTMIPDAIWPMSKIWSQWIYPLYIGLKAGIEWMKFVSLLVSF